MKDIDWFRQFYFMKTSTNSRLRVELSTRESNLHGDLKSHALHYAADGYRNAGRCADIDMGINKIVGVGATEE